MRFIHLFILFFPIIAFTQIDKPITAEERAYLYHSVQNTPIFSNYMGKYFEYVGPKILFPNKKVNEDSLASYMTIYPDSLHIYASEIAKAPKGVVVEAINKMVMWELNRLLYLKRGTPSELAPYEADYASFEKILLSHLPPNATLTENGVLKPHPKLDKVLNPQLSCDDKLIALGSYQFLNENDELVTINAIGKAVNEFVSTRTYYICKELGIPFDLYKNVLLAAGDGTISSQEFLDREAKDQSKWVIGLPKTMGLIPYQTKRSPANGAILSKIDPLTYPSQDFKTAGENKITTVHIDVWGYNPEKQVTVIIEKNSKCYPLFSAGNSRMLSPDSSFSKSGTFKQRMDELEFKKIKDLNEMIYGKKGFDHWIEYNNKKKDQTELEIVKLEKKYMDFGYSSVKLDKKKTKPSKKKPARSKNDPDKLADYNLSNHPEQDERRKTQDEIVRLHKVYDDYTKKIKELEIQKKQALELLAEYQQRLDQYKQVFGYHWASYKSKGGVYCFNDSTTFDFNSQELKFPATSNPEAFEIRLLAIPEECLSNTFDEVMTHISVIDELPNFDAKINKEFTNTFLPYTWNFKESILTKTDSVALQEIFTSILKEKKKMKFSIEGNGIGKWNGSRVVKDPLPITDTNALKLEKNLERLNTSYLTIENKNNITITISTFTSPYTFDYKWENPLFNELIVSKKCRSNDLISAYRSFVIYQTLEKELLNYGKSMLNETDYNKLEKKLQKTSSKLKIQLNKLSLSYKEFN